MSESKKWRECADPVELAAAVAARVEVQRNWGYDWQPGTNNETAEQFAGCTKANCRYRVPASWSWSPEPPAPDDLVSRARRHAETHPESRELIEELLEELLETVVRWACFAAPSPVPPWPGAVLSGLVDEDGVPTWLAQAGRGRRPVSGVEMPKAPVGYVACRVADRGGLIPALPVRQVTHLVELDANGRNGGRPTVCGLTRFDERDPLGMTLLRAADLPGWGMGDTGVHGPGVEQVKCPGCWDAARDGDR